MNLRHDRSDSEKLGSCVYISQEKIRVLGWEMRDLRLRDAINAFRCDLLRREWWWLLGRLCTEDGQLLLLSLVLRRELVDVETRSRIDIMLA